VLPRQPVAVIAKLITLILGHSQVIQEIAVGAVNRYLAYKIVVKSYTWKNTRKLRIAVIMMTAVRIITVLSFLNKLTHLKSPVGTCMGVYTDRCTGWLTLLRQWQMIKLDLKI
jgi:hypothetical protein